MAWGYQRRVSVFVAANMADEIFPLPAQQYPARENLHKSVIGRLEACTAPKACSTPSESPPLLQSLLRGFARTFAKQVVVFGGNGFVGQNVCQAALLMGADVVSVNRSGPPAGKEKAWKDTVKWVQADIFKPEDYATEVGRCLSSESRYYESVVVLHIFV